MPLTSAEKASLKSDFGDYLESRQVNTLNDLDMEIIAGFGPAEALTIPYQTAGLIIDEFHDILGDEVNQGIIAGVISIVESVEEFVNNTVEEFAGDMESGGQGGGGGN